MPNPVPLATKEEEERRAWVTSHHEVVRLVKDCFGDRFSNNEIFDRLKISRRTGYRALGNDERIGKAPGRKPKILEETVKEMIEYIEAGGCNDVGNVWKHLSEKYAPNCNPKTVQDAVKKSGFRNYNSNVKLEPLLNEQLAENAPAPDEEDAARRLQEDVANAQRAHQQVEHDQQQQEHAHRQQQSQPPNVYDPALQQQTSPHEFLRHAIATFPQDYVRYVLNDIVARNQECMVIAHQHFTQHPYPSQQAVSSPIAHLGLASSPSLHNLHSSQLTPHDAAGNKRRLAICRRCGLQFDRAENKMENRECLYHKGSTQKIDPNGMGTVEVAPEAYMWSCCGGNGAVRGCCRAMHTTKKKRRYFGLKKRPLNVLYGDADLDDGDEGSNGDGTEDHLEAKAALLQSSHMTGEHLGSELTAYNPYHTALAATGVADANIDSNLQDGTSLGHSTQQSAAQAAQVAQAAIHPHMQMDLSDMEGGSASNAGPNGGDHDISNDIGAQLQAVTNGHGI